MSWRDEDIDKLYRDSANNQSFEYKDAYFEEMEALRAEAGTLSADAEWSDNGIDEIYQEGAKNLEFAYKDAYWKEFEPMLPAQRRYDAVWFGAAFFFVGLLLFTPFIKQEINEQRGNTAQLSVPKSVENNAENNIKPQNDVVTASNQTVQQSVSVEQNNGLANQVDATGPVLNQPENGLLNNDLTANESESHAPTHGETGGEVESNDLAVETHNPSLEASEVGVLPSPNDEGSLTNNVAAANENSDTQEASNEKERENEAHSSTNLEVTEASTASIEKGEVGTLALRTIAQTTDAGELLEGTHFERKLPVTKPILYIEANGGLSQSLITPSDALSYSYGVGLGARLQKGNLAFTLGVNGNVSHHDDIVLSREAKQYGFGSDVYKYTLKYEQLYSVEGMLSIGYTFGRHQLSVGVRPSYLLSTKVGYTQNFTTTDEALEDRQVVYGHMDGINRFGIKPMIGYSVDLPRNWTVGLNVGTQLMKAVNEVYINGINNKLPIDGQLFIRKSISFK